MGTRASKVKVSRGYVGDIVKLHGVRVVKTGNS